MSRKEQKYMRKRMKGKKQNIAIAIWSVVILSAQLVYGVLQWNTVTDSYGFGAKEGRELLSSGLSFAYSNFLSRIFSLTGNNIHAAFIVQLLLQVMTAVLLFCAVSFLGGVVAAFVAGTAWIVYPMIFLKNTVLDPFFYYMFYFSLLFFLLSFFYHTVRKRGWSRSSICELYLMLLGFCIGVLFIWNYMTWMLIVVIVYGSTITYSVTRERIFQQKESHKQITEREQIMSSFSQWVIILSGALIGMYSTLMKYTGITGNYLFDQTRWWISQYRDFPEKCQEIGWEKAVAVAAILLAAAVCGCLLKHLRQKKEDREYMSKSSVKPQQPESFVTEDGRTVEYLKNPLPVPKRHVAKEMQFEFDVNDPGEFDIIDLDEKTELK